MTEKRKNIGIPESDQSQVNRIVREARRHGYERITPKLLKKDAQRLGLVAPDNKSLKEAENWLSFRKYFHGGHGCYIHTTFHTKEKRFIEKGIMTVIIKKNEEKTVYLHRFQRGPTGATRLIKEIRVIDICFKERPLDKKNRGMDLDRNRYTGDIFWISAIDPNEKKPFFPKNLSRNLHRHVKGVVGSRQYYLTRGRSKKKIQNYIWDIKKSWNVTNPENRE